MHLTKIPPRGMERLRQEFREEQKVSSITDKRAANLVKAREARKLKRESLGEQTANS